MTKARGPKQTARHSSASHLGEKELDTEKDEKQEIPGRLLATHDKDHVDNNQSINPSNGGESSSSPSWSKLYSNSS
jgi:hypothetical protein